MARRLTSLPFPWIIAVCGIVCLCFIVGNLLVLGTHRYPQKPKLVTSGHADRGREAIYRYGCGGCHVIPGVTNAVGRVGPSLVAFSRQSFIAGVLANTPDNLANWIADPQHASPRTAMPDLDVPLEEAHDIAAYLYAE